MDASMQVELILGLRSVKCESIPLSQKVRVIRNIIDQSGIYSLTGFSTLSHLLEADEGNKLVIDPLVLKADGRLSTREHVQCIHFFYEFKDGVRHEEKLLLLRDRGLIHWKGACQFKGNIYSFLELTLSLCDDDRLAEYLERPCLNRWGLAHPDRFNQILDTIRKIYVQSIRRREQDLNIQREEITALLGIQKRLGYFPTLDDN